MNDDIIEIKLFDKDHIKYFQLKAPINNKKALEALNETLKNKGITFIFKRCKDIDFF